MGGAVGCPAGKRQTDGDGDGDVDEVREREVWACRGVRGGIRWKRLTCMRAGSGLVADVRTCRAAARASGH